MSTTNRQFDLNLIRVFCTVYDTGSLTISAEMLDITQPAISHALKKLRGFYDDPLFVRSEGKMLPTPVAKKIAPNFKKSVELINVSLQSNMFFMAESSKKSFNISMSDMAQIFFLPPLCLVMEDLLEKIEINICHTPQDKVERLMRLGELDFAIGNLPELDEIPHKVGQTNLFKDKFVCMVREGHPLILNRGKGIDFSKLNLLEVRNNSTGHTKLVQELQKQYFNHVSLTIPNYTASPQIVQKTDLAVLIPRSIALRYNADNQFLFFDLEGENIEIDVNIYYHKLYENDKSLIWFRDIVLRNFIDN